MSEGPNFNVPMAEATKPVPQKAPGTSGKAIASLILGLVSIVGMCFTGIPGLILGIIGLSDIGKSEGRISGKGMATVGIVLSSLGILWTVVAILVGMLLPAVQQVRTAARRVVSQNNMRQQVLCMHNYESAYGAFPKQNNSGLSWRVHVLPFLDQKPLYDRFNLDEPWDSPNNILLLPEMPPTFDNPNVVLPPGFTVYQVPYTDLNLNSEPETSALFDTGDQGVTWGEIKDGSSNTIAVIEVDQAAAVEWTKPDDWKFDPADPLHDVGNLQPGSILIALADGSAHVISNNISPEELKALITRDGGEEVHTITY